VNMTRLLPHQFRPSYLPG